MAFHRVHNAALCSGPCRCISVPGRSGNGLRRSHEYAGGARIAHEVQRADLHARHLPEDRAVGGQLRGVDDDLGAALGRDRLVQRPQRGRQLVEPGHEPPAAGGAAHQARDVARTGAPGRAGSSSGGGPRRRGRRTRGRARPARTGTTRTAARTRRSGPRARRVPTGTGPRRPTRTRRAGPGCCRGSCSRCDPTRRCRGPSPTPPDEALVDVDRAVGGVLPVVASEDVGAERRGAGPFGIGVGQRPFERRAQPVYVTRREQATAGPFVPEHLEVRRDVARDDAACRTTRPRAG